MASAKEYEILFKLNAQQNSGFSLTFSKAQAEFVKLGNEIKNLQKIQSDVSSYEKQQKAIDATERKLENLTKQQDILRKQIDDTKAAGESSAALEREELKLEQQIANTTAALERQRDKLDTTGERLRSAGVDTDNLANKSEELTAQIKDLQQKQEEAADGAQGFGQRSSEAFSAVASAIAAAGIAVALREIYEGYMECIEVASGFEESMSNVKALSGATADELEDLGGLAKELGATTKFTAKESADAMGYMAMAGWNAEQMLSGMPGVLQLAAASGEDLALVSDIVTDSLTAFGLTASDTSRYADILAQTATKANTNVALMGETFKYAAPLAGALKYDVEDVAVATGLMANAGIKGSEAGTTLRNIFTRLAKPTKESADAMDALGLSMSDGTGKMYTWMELMEQMRDSFAGLTEEQKTFYAAELAGQRGMSGLLSIVNASEEDFNKLSVAISNSSGAAQQMADIKLDNLNGQITLFNSALEATKTTIGEQLNPTISELYGIGTEVLGRINEYLKEHPEVVRAVTAAAIGIGTVTAAVTAFAAVTKVVIPLMTAFSAAIPGVGIILGVGTAIASVTAAMVLARSEFNNVNYVERQHKAELEKLNEEYAEACRIYGETSDQANALRYQIMSLTDEYGENAKAVGDAMKEHGNLIDSLHDTSAAYSETLTSIKDEGLDARALAGELNRLASSYTGTSGEAMVMNGIIDQLNEQYSGLNLTLDQVTNGTYNWGESLDDFIKRSAAAKKSAEDMARAQQLVLEHSGLEQDAAEIEKQIAAAEAEVSRLKALNDSAPVGYMGNTVYTAVLGKARADLAILQSSLRETQDAMQDNEAEYATLLDVLNGGDLSEAERQQSALENVLGGVASQLEILANDYAAAYAAAVRSVEGQFNIWDEAAEVVPASIDAITKAMQGQADYWTQYSDNLDYLRDQAQSVEGLGDIIADLADGNEKSISVAAGLAKALKDGDGDVAAMIATYKQLQEAQGKVEESMTMTAGNFEEKLAEMQGSLEDAVENMDVSDLAGNSAQNTIQAFIDKANRMLPQVQAAYDRLGIAAARGLAASSPSGITLSTNTDGRLKIVGAAAEGSDSAKRGYYLVGEEGPELVWMNGGERVFDAQETAAMQDAMSVTALSPALLRLMDTELRSTQSHTDIVKSGAANVAPMVSADAGLQGAADASRSRGGAAGEAPTFNLTVNVHIDGDATPEAAQAAQDAGRSIAESIRDSLDEWWEDKQIQFERSWY